jgi:hypothetical protein
MSDVVVELILMAVDAQTKQKGEKRQKSDGLLFACVMCVVEMLTVHKARPNYTPKIFWIFRFSLKNINARTGNVSTFE